MTPLKLSPSPYFLFLIGAVIKQSCLQIKLEFSSGSLTEPELEHKMCSVSNKLETSFTPVIQPEKTVRLARFSELHIHVCQAKLWHNTI